MSDNTNRKKELCEVERHDGDARKVEILESLTDDLPLQLIPRTQFDT